MSSGCLLISFTVCCHRSLSYSKRPSHTTFPNLASCQFVLLKTRFFLLIHIAHKVTPRNRVHKELNFLRLLGSHFLKKHCSMLRAFQVQPGLGYRKVISSFACSWTMPKPLGSRFGLCKVTRGTLNLNTMSSFSSPCVDGKDLVSQWANKTRVFSSSLLYPHILPF